MNLMNRLDETESAVFKSVMMSTTRNTRISDGAYTHKYAKS